MHTFSLMLLLVPLLATPPSDAAHLAIFKAGRPVVTGGSRFLYRGPTITTTPFVDLHHGHLETPMTWSEHERGSFMREKTHTPVIIAQSTWNPTWRPDQHFEGQSGLLQRMRKESDRVMVPEDYVHIEKEGEGVRHSKNFGMIFPTTPHFTVGPNTGTVGTTTKSQLTLLSEFGARHPIVQVHQLIPMFNDILTGVRLQPKESHIISASNFFVTYDLKADAYHAHVFSVPYTPGSVTREEERVHELWEMFWRIVHDPTVGGGAFDGHVEGDVSALKRFLMNMSQYRTLAEVAKDPFLTQQHQLGRVL